MVIFEGTDVDVLDELLSAARARVAEHCRRRWRALWEGANASAEERNAAEIINASNTMLGNDERLIISRCYWC